MTRTLNLIHPPELTHKLKVYLRCSIRQMSFSILIENIWLQNNQLSCPHIKFKHSRFKMWKMELTCCMCTQKWKTRKEVQHSLSNGKCHSKLISPFDCILVYMWWQRCLLVYFEIFEHFVRWLDFIYCGNIILIIKLHHICLALNLGFMA